MQSTSTHRVASEAQPETCNLSVHEHNEGIGGRIDASHTYGLMLRNHIVHPRVAENVEVSLKYRGYLERQVWDQVHP